MLRIAALLLALAPFAAAQDALLQLGDAFTGSIDSAFDSDAVHFEAVAGTLLTASAKGAKGFHPTLALTDLSTGEPVDLTGFLFGAGGTKATIKKLPLPSTGEYELSVGPFDDTLGGYKLTTKGVISKTLKVLKDGSASEPGTGELHFAATAGTKLTGVVKPAKGFDVVPGVPLVTGPDGAMDISSAVELTDGKVPTAKITGFVFDLLGDYTFTPVAAADGDAPPLVTVLKLTFPKHKKTTLAETGTFKNQDTQLVSQKTGGQQAAAGSLDAVTTLNGKVVAFLSFATNLVTGCGGGIAGNPGDPPVYDVFVRDLDAGTTVAASVPTAATTNGPGGCESPSIDSAGTVVAFGSSGLGLVAGDGNGAKDVFVRELGTLTTTRVSVTSLGAEAHGQSTDPSLSGDGRFVAFASTAEDLVADDDNGQQDVFVHDRQTGATTRISVTAGGAQIHGVSGEPSFSRDGTRVAFSSTAQDLLAGDNNGKKDVYVKVLATGEVLRATLTDAGAQIEADAEAPALSGDGRFVAFYSTGHFAAGDGNFTDIFVKDLLTGTVDIASLGAGGAANGNSSLPKISANGQLVIFRSLAGNLVPGGDVNGPLNGDVYLRDRGAGTTIRISVGTFLAEPGNGDSYPGDLSGDGTHALIFGTSTNLTPGDQNGSSDVWVRF